MNSDSQQLVETFGKLLSQTGLYPDRGITFKEVMSMFSVNEQLAKDTLQWAVHHGLLLPVYNEVSTDTLYQFINHQVRNGTSIQVDPDKMDLIRLSEVPGHSFLLSAGLHGEQFDVGRRDSNACMVLGDGRVFIRDFGYFPQVFFRNSEPAKKRSRA